MAKLRPKQARFVEEYLVDLNAIQAAIRVGYSADTAKSIGCENLTKPDIAEAIAEKPRAIANVIHGRFGMPHQAAMRLREVLAA